MKPLSLFVNAKLHGTQSLLEDGMEIRRGRDWAWRGWIDVMLVYYVNTFIHLYVYLDIFMGSKVMYILIAYSHMSRYFPKEGHENEDLQARSLFVNKQSVSSWFADRGMPSTIWCDDVWSLCVMKRLSIMDMWIHCVSQAMANLLTFKTWRVISWPFGDFKIQEHDIWPGLTNGQFWTLTTEHGHWFVWELHPHIDLLCYTCFLTY